MVHAAYPAVAAIVAPINPIFGTKITNRKKLTIRLKIVANETTPGRLIPLK